MKYIKSYEGFRIDQLENIKTSVKKFTREGNKKNINSEKLIN